MSSQPPLDCSHRPTCPGCPHFGLPGVASDALGRIAALAEGSGALALPAVSAGSEAGDLELAFGNRHRARLMVRGRAASPKIGIFQTGSHKIADIPRCHVHHPVINRVAALLKESIRATRTDPYADGPHRGCVRAVQVVVERSSECAQVVLITNDADPGRPRELLVDFEDRLRRAELLQSLWWNGNPERTNTILGPSFELIAARAAESVEENAGERGWVRESIGGANVFFPPAAFGQSHLRLADALVDRVHAFASGAARAAEFYAGCGSIGLGLLARGAHVAFNEQNPAGVAGLRRGIASLDSLEAQARSRILQGAAGECLDVLDGAEVAIVDPPRKGLDEALLRALAAGAVEHLAYISCGLDSLERDIAALIEPGRMRLLSLEPFALFPFSDHVETLALFKRA